MNHFHNVNSEYTNELRRPMSIPDKKIISTSHVNVVNNNWKSVNKPKLKISNQIRKNDKDFKQNLNKIQSTGQSIPRTNLCRLQDLCVEDRCKLNQLIMKLAEAQEALNRMDTKLKEQSIENNINKHDGMSKSNPFINSDTCPSSVEQNVYPSKTDQLITFYKTKLEHLENELSQLRCNFKKEQQSMPNCENNQSMETIIEIKPNIMNDVEQVAQLNQSNNNVNNFSKQSSSHIVDHNPQCNQHMNYNDMTTNCDMLQNMNISENNQHNIKSINNHNHTNSNNDSIVKSTNQTRNQIVTTFKQKNCSNFVPVWEFINANDNSIVNIQCIDTRSNQTIKKNTSIMTEPINMTIQSIHCSVEKSTQTIMNEFQDKYMRNYPGELNTSISTPTSLQSHVVLNNGNNKSLTNSSAQTDSVNHHYDYYNNNKTNRARKCAKVKIQNNQTRRSGEKRRRNIRNNRFVQKKSESFSSSSSSFSSSSSSNSSTPSSFLSKKNEKSDDDNIDTDRNNKVKLTSFQMPEGNHQIGQNVEKKLLNVSNDNYSMYNIQSNNQKTNILLPKDHGKQIGDISQSLPHCKIFQEQRDQRQLPQPSPSPPQQQQRQQNESIIEINSDKELESIIKLMNETFQDNDHIIKQTQTLLIQPYQQSKSITTHKQQQQQHYDHFYPSSYYHHEQDELWNDIIDNDCNISNMMEVNFEEEEEEGLLNDLFFIK
ncbi:unnamed protein product [Schistosoma rodhaini]|uniref:Uncharacterized protein n=1 Tax=Schistosoma rodhaini TaxID=6188 RepID=A0AA85GEA4_9TREM|nr:unnamed protein product [Schistosoma rodhaini]CAH8648743.1 unnamed protein product [Schistosoma rodhaini]